MIREVKFSRMVISAICVIFIVFTSLANVNASMSQEKYDGSDVFEIKTAEDFLEISSSYENKESVPSFSGKTIKLMSDIDLEMREITPIGSSKCAFEGTFDGQGYTIKNFTVKNNSLNFSGLFGITYFAQIKDLNVENASIVGCNAVGGLIGESIFSKITNCKVKNVELTFEGQDKDIYIGGLVGANTSNTVGYYSEEYDYTEPWSLIENCSATGKISLNSLAQSICAGGLIGLNRSISDFSKVEVPCKTVVKNSTANVDIEGAKELTMDSRIKLTLIGGFVGLNHDTNGTSSSGSIIDGCKSEGNVSGGISRYVMYIGGFAGANSGYHGNSIIRNCSSSGQVNAGKIVEVINTKGMLYAGGFIGGLNTTKVVPVGFEDSMKQSQENEMKKSQVYNCYTTSGLKKGIAGNVYTGGFAGVCEAFNGQTLMINCYSANKIDEADEDPENIEKVLDCVGGLVGGIMNAESDKGNSATIKDSYWNEELSNLKEGIGSNTSNNASISIEGLTENVFSSETGLLKKLNDNVNTHDTENLWKHWIIDKTVNKYPVFDLSVTSNESLGEVKKFSKILIVSVVCICLLFTYFGVKMIRMFLKNREQK